MSQSELPSSSAVPHHQPAQRTGNKPSKAGRDLPAAITSAAVLIAAVVLSLAFNKALFLVVVVAAVAVGVWELRRGLLSKEIDLPEQPLIVGGAAMVITAFVWGPVALLSTTALTVLTAMLWLLRRGVTGYVQNATAAVFTLIYLPFLASFVALLLAEQGAPGSFGLDNGVRGIVTFIALAVASDTGGYLAGIFFGKHKMAPEISPKKSWEGFAGSALATVVVGTTLVVFWLGGPWWAGVLLGVVGVVMATFGDLCESVIKRDLGIKDMSQVIPGHGGLMDRLDSLLAIIAPVWAILHFLVF
jgi:phosphatidate cytidylyltransferase